MSAQISRLSKWKSKRARAQSKPTMPQTAASILRVSTKKQLNDGDGIENQRRGNTEYIRRKGYTLAKEFVVAESASGMERADFEAVISEVIQHRPQIQVLIFWKVDRISRGGVLPYYTLKGILAKHGIRIEFATEQIDASPTGELMETLLAGMARFENRLRVDRTIGVEKILTRDGYWCRGAPTGFKNGRKDGKPILVPNTENGQWDLLRSGLKKVLSGAYTVSEVHREMRDRGLKSSTGLPMARQTWFNICASPVYGGLICGEWTDGEYVRAKFDGPLTPEEWRELQRVLGWDVPAGSDRPPRKKIHPDFPLRQFLRCPNCRGPSRGYAARGSRGGLFRYYDCKNVACQFRIRADEGHTLFTERLQELTPSPACLEAFKAVAQNAWQEIVTANSASELATQERDQKLQKEKANLLALMKQSADDPELLEDLKRELTEIRKELSLLTITGSGQGLESLDKQKIIETAALSLARLVELWDSWPLEAKTQLQRLIYPTGLTLHELEGCRTPKISPLFATIAKLQRSNSHVVPPVSRMSNSFLDELVAFFELCQAARIGHG